MLSPRRPMPPTTPPCHAMHHHAPPCHAATKSLTSVQINKQAHHDITQRNRCLPDFCKTVQRKNRLAVHYVCYQWHMIYTVYYTVAGKREPADEGLFFCWWVSRRQWGRLEVAFKWGLLCDNCLTPQPKWEHPQIYEVAVSRGPLVWAGAPTKNVLKNWPLLSNQLAGKILLSIYFNLCLLLSLSFYVHPHFFQGQFMISPLGYRW